MPSVEMHQCDGPGCEEMSRDYVLSKWIAVPCMSWYDGYKRVEQIIEGKAKFQEEPAYKKCIVFDEGRGSKLFCSWNCFESFIKE